MKRLTCLEIENLKGIIHHLNRLCAELRTNKRDVNIRNAVQDALDDLQHVLFLAKMLKHDIPKETIARVVKEFFEKQ